MFLAVYNDQNKERQCWIYNSKEEYIKDTFSPECEKILTLDFKVSGKTYQERKAALRELAIDYSYSTSEIYPISWGEVSIIEGFFRHNGKRYGCLTEFRENAIC